MRCYHLCNMYLSSIQQGIQSAHAQMELFVKYEKNLVPNYTSVQKQYLYAWAENHKTMIVLNGGFLNTMQDTLDFLSNEENTYPFAPFYESQEALGGILTNIAIVLPEKIYKTSELLRTKMIDENLSINPNLSFEMSSEIENIMSGFGKFTPFEIALATYMNMFKLAN